MIQGARSFRSASDTGASSVGETVAGLVALALEAEAGDAIETHGIDTVEWDYL